VRAILDEAALLTHAGDALARAAEAIGAQPLDLVLHGGEDYALLATSSAPIPGFSRIGEIRAGEGLALRSEEGERPLTPSGYDHFG
jgi:thiamine-monophosphate kinase